MATEQLPNSPASSQKEVVLSFGPFTKKWANDDEFVESMLRIEQKVYDSIKVKVSKPVEEAIKEAVSQGYLLGEYWVHKSHYDGRVAGKAVRAAIDISKSEKNGIDKVAAPWAKSILSGHQDSKLKLFSERLRPKIAEDGLELIDFSRDVDHERYGLERNLEEYDEEMRLKIKQGYGIGIWPEATVRGGRKDKKTRKPHRMQRFKPGIRRIARFAMNEGRMPFLIPVAMDNTHRILSPDTYLPPTGTVLRTIIPIFPNVPIEVRFGMPIKWDELQYYLKKEGLDPNNDDVINNYFGKKLNEIVSKSERGFYNK